MPRKIIGLTGSFGSGASTVAEYLGEMGYQRVSLSDELHSRFPNATRSQLQEEGNKLRASDPAYLARQVLERIDKSDQNSKWVVDSIRNPSEVRNLASSTSEFYLFAVFADKRLRWERVKGIANYTHSQFEADDWKDAGDDEPSHGQRVRDCYSIADVIISNNENWRIRKDKIEESLKQTVRQYVEYVEGKPFVPDVDEALMAQAYANSLRSVCLKRKVGAIIAAPSGDIISSGFNAVPPKELHCMEAFEGRCYRDHMRERFREALIPKLKDASDAEELSGMFKNLDYCRALHAEENAILNAPQHIRLFPERAPEMAPQESDDVVTMYVTTYPCNLCANKIARSSVRKVVYLEPYPMDEAKTILDHAKVLQVPFQGVTFNGYFRFGRYAR
ncbi:MAG: AAA family ATPase [Bacillota bacterium]